MIFTDDMEEGNMGIFGMSHEELLKSEWVVEGALTAKFELEVRPNVELDPMPLKRASIEVPQATCLAIERPLSKLPFRRIAADLMTMFEEGKGADVAFLVQGERIMGHSQILAARSSVLEHHLNSGMKESITKERALT